MKNPSKKTAALAEVEAVKAQAAAENDIEAFTQAVRDIERISAQDDEYTCICCAKDFSAEAPHIDILVAAVLVLGIESGEFKTLAQADYGILATSRRESGRRIKVCGDCTKEWKIPILEYLEMR